MESAQEGELWCIEQALEWVSILVVMESAQEVCAGQDRRDGGAPVSILVVMESAQEVERRAVRQHRGKRFNPCCNGKCSGSRESAAKMYDRVAFQSLL